MSPQERRDMIRKDNTNLSLTRQCKVLKIRRSSIYYTPVGLDQATAKLKDVDPQAWLADTIARTPDYKINRVDDRLPWKIAS